MIQAVVFNLDGVLVDSGNCHYQAWKQMAREQGIPFSPAIYQNIEGMKRMDGLQQLLRRAERTYLPGEMWALAARKNDLFNDLIAHLGPESILPGALETLNALRGMGIKTAVASSSENAGGIIRQVGLKPLLDAVIDGEEIMEGKPDPEVYLLVARRLMMPTCDCLAVENSLAGVEAARQAGMKVLALGKAAEENAGNFRVDTLQEIDLARMIMQGNADAFFVN